MIEITKTDIVSYLVDCQCFDVEEAREMVENHPDYESFMTRAEISGMKAFLGLSPLISKLAAV